MKRWGDLEVDVSELAAKVRGRFDAFGLGLLATVRRDGSPRISGIEPLFGEGELWLGMMNESLKAKDLLRDGRCALHSATTDKDVSEGDAKIAGVARPVQDADTFALYGRASGASEGPSPGDFHLFRVELSEMSFLRPAGDHLVIESWNARRGYRLTRRY